MASRPGEVCWCIWPGECHEEAVEGDWIGVCSNLTWALAPAMGPRAAARLAG